MEFPPHILNILRQRYFKDGESSWEQVVERVISQASLAEKSDKREWFKDAIRPYINDMLFVPGGRILSEAGGSNQMMNCETTPVEDSLEKIFKETLYAQMRLYSRSGSSGFSFDKLSARGTKTTRGYAAGPLAFMELISTVARTIFQESTRNPGSMGVLSVNHPDILNFIRCKMLPDTRAQKVLESMSEFGHFLGSENQEKLLLKLKQLLSEVYQFSNFNISVAVTDDFMESVYKEEGEDQLPKENFSRNDEIYKALTDAMYHNGEPGILFIDQINRWHPLPNLISATNVCAEQPLLPWEGCCLGSLNLSHLRVYNYEEILKKVIPIAVRFLDNIIDVTEYAHSSYEKAQKRTRKIGLGIMGWADFLLNQGIRYSSHESYKLVRSIGALLFEESYMSSHFLAKEKGYNRAMRAAIQEKNNNLPKLEEFQTLYRRNTCLNTIAPTGTTSLIAQTSSGIEPIFDWKFERFDEVSPKGQIYDWHPKVIEHCEENGIKDIEDFVNSGKLPSVFVRAQGLFPTQHVDMVAEWQKYIDSSISKTINASEDTTFEDLTKLIHYAWKRGLKAFTFYREGSREFEVLKKVVQLEKAFKGEDVDIQKLYFPGELVSKYKHPQQRNGKVYSMPTGLTTLHVTITEDENGAPIEIFLNVGKAGSDASAFAEALGRQMSVSLQQVYNVPQNRLNLLRTFAKQLSGIGGDAQIPHESGRIRSVPDALGKILFQYLDERKEKIEEPLNSSDVVLFGMSVDALYHMCQNCKREFKLTSKMKCPTCPFCGFSECDG